MLRDNVDMDADAILKRARGWNESDLRKFPTATLELIDVLIALAEANPAAALAKDAASTQGLVGPPSKLPQSFDARDWAKEFTTICASKGIVIDEEWMVTWFANALMAGYDQRAKDTAGALELLSELATWAQATRDHRFNHDHDCICDRAAALAAGREK